MVRHGESTLHRLLFAHCPEFRPQRIKVIKPAYIFLQYCPGNKITTHTEQNKSPPPTSLHLIPLSNCPTRRVGIAGRVGGTKLRIRVNIPQQHTWSPINSGESGVTVDGFLLIGDKAAAYISGNALAARAKLTPPGPARGNHVHTHTHTVLEPLPLNVPDPTPIPSPGDCRRSRGMSPGRKG